MRRGTAIAALMAVAAALAGCGSSSSGKSSSTSTAAKAASAATSTGATSTGAASTSTASSDASSNSASGGSDDTAAVQKTMMTYMTGVAHGDGAAACGALSPAASRQIVAVGRSEGYKTCESAIQGISKKLPAATKDQLRSVRVTDVHVSGSSATAKYKGSAATVHLTKSGGRWYISGGFKT